MTDAPLVPRPWQEADIAKMVKSITPEAGALVTSAPGAGKTLVATEVIRRLGVEVVLVVAPPATHPSWERTLRRQGVSDFVRHLSGTAKGKKNFQALMWGEPGVYITSAQWFTRAKWDGIEPGAVIIDEIHMLAKYGNAGMKKLVGHGRTKGIKSPVRIGLSGTPFRNNFENAWTVARWIEPAIVPKEYWIWRATECAGTYDHFAPQNMRVTGEKQPGKLVSSMTCHVAHRQRERCCDWHPNGFLAELGEPLVVQRDLTMTAAQAAFYRSMEETYFAYLTTPDKDGKVPVVAELPIVARGMLRFCALALPSINEETEKLYFEDDADSPKIDAVLGDLPALDGARVLMLTHSRLFAFVVTHRLVKAGHRAVVWPGGLSKAARQAILTGFQAGDIDIIVGVISAMGTGTDGLQEAAYNIMYLSVDDDPSNNVQGISRLDRLGQKHQVVIHEYRMLNTFDVGHLSKQIQKQLDLNKSLIEEGA